MLVHCQDCSAYDSVTDAAAAVLAAPDAACRQASYALGYNLAIEYLADYEKTWMLDSFRDLNTRVLHKDIDWIFLEVRGGGGGGAEQHGAAQCSSAHWSPVQRIVVQCSAVRHSAVQCSL
jgi:hypothetical protein